jgi:urease accessory protein
MLLIQFHVLDASPRPVAEQVRLRVERRMFLKRRWRAVAEDGVEFGFDLTGRLHTGAVIHRTETADYVIQQEEEPVYEIRYTDAAQAALVGWKIGNLHFPVEIGAGWLRVTRDLAVTQLCEREGWAVTEAEVIFNPLRVTAHAS